MSARIRQSVSRLQELPDSGRVGRIAGTRELVVPGLPYILPYRIGKDQIQILAILHGNLLWPAEF